MTEGRMVQVHGEAIQRCLETANLTEVTEEVEGEEILQLGGAADGQDGESNETGGIAGTWDTEVTVVRSVEETGSAAAGEYCLKISGPNSNHTKDSGIHQPSTRFVLPGNSRFRFTCKVYCEQQGDRFALALQSDRRFLTSLHSTQIWAKNADNTGEYFQNSPGEWTEFNGILTTLDEGDREYRLWIHHDEGGPMTWYLDDIAIVPLRTETRRIPFREKSPEEAELTLAGINANRVNLYNRGEIIPISIENAAQDGGFLNETTVTFWGEPPVARDGGKNVVTPENTYVLSFDSPDPPLRYRLAPPAPRQAGAAVFRSFPRTRRIEENNALQYYQKYDGPPTDRVMWASFKAPPWEPATVELPPIDDCAGELAEVGVIAHFWGWSDLPVSPDHFWELSLNGAPLGTAQWDGPRLFVAEATVPGRSVFSDRANELTVQPTNDDIQLDLISLDWIELTYDAALLPRDDFLEFTAAPATAPRYAQTEAGFGDSKVRVYTEGSELVQTPSSFSKRNRHAVEIPLDSAGGRYRAVGPKGFARPARLAVGYASDLRQLDDVPDYLIVTHASFVEALRPLVKWRTEQGLRTLVVDVEDLYDEYADSLFDPEAIRLFVDDLIQKQDGTDRSLRYIWLVGDATYDYLGIRPGSRNYVPTHHTNDADILPNYSPTIAHDDYFAFGPRGSDVPLAAVGRLPASSIETVKAYVAKTLEYEQRAGEDAAWKQRAVLISSKDFNRFSNDTANNILPDWSVDNLTGTGDQEGDIQLRNTIIEKISGGCGVVTFTGHGAYYVWRTGENMNDQRTDMMTDREIDLLANSGKYPIVFAATCFSSLFDAPIHGMSRADSGVGIYFVQAENKGAVALIGHVGKVDVAAGHQFNRSVLEGLIAKPGSRLGDQFLEAKRRFPDRAFHGVALIGDPALVVSLE
ncbi:MAG: hypothetical protein KJ060_07995 [Candidatus Hydrogenedentes bacterium]|nr:hypothetical protein [Candidatus Hydrogenedentota bacterium]